LINGADPKPAPDINYEGKMQISFATLAIPPFWEKEAVLLVESLRTFGGRLAHSSQSHY